MKEKHEQLLKESLAHLGRVFSPREEIIISSEGHPLFLACEVVGQMMGLTFKMPPTKACTVEGICEASNIRYRQVRMKKSWWKESHGHLIGFEKETHQPVVLLQTPSGYESFNPTTQQRTKVNETTNESLETVGYTFYRSLPEERLTLSKILQLCTAGMVGDYLFLFLVGLLATVAAFFFPIANKVLFDYVIPDFNVDLYVQVMIGLFLAAFSSSFFFFMRSLLMLRLDGILENRLQMLLWDRLLKLPVHFFHKIATGDLIQRTFVVENIRTQLSENTLRVFLNSIFSLAYLLVMFFFSFPLAMLGLFFAFITSVLSTGFFLSILHYQRRILASNAAINTFLTQAISAIGKIRVAVAEHLIFAKWTNEFARNQRLTFKAQNLQNVAKTCTTALNLSANLFVFAIIIYVMSQELPPTTSHKAIPPFTIGTFLAFMAAFFPFFEAVTDLTSTLLSSVELIPFWERAAPIFTSPAEVTTEKTNPGILQGSILVENLSFRYNKNGPFLLDRISFHANPGEFIAIVGPSGCGKSTLCRLLIGFETPEKGRILYDQKDLAGLDPYKVREQIGTVLQNSAIFNGTVKENITCGFHYSDDEIERALQLSTFEEDIAYLPMKLETVLPSGGTVLSGGQRQRLILARALIRQPKILILDEATSFLDNKTQDLITKNLENLKATRIVIAHRLSTIKRADRIYKIEEGQLKEINGQNSPQTVS